MRRFLTLDGFLADPTMGIGAATSGFLRALIARDPFDEYRFYRPDPASSATTAEILSAAFPEAARAGKFVCRTVLDLPVDLPELDAEVLHLSDVGSRMAHAARVRNLWARRMFPVTGVTHTLSYARSAVDFAALVWPGWSARDAIGATSTAGEAVMRRVFEETRERLGLGEVFQPPALARIALGVDTRTLRPPTPEERAHARDACGLATDEIAVLVFGRLSHHSKMDVLPLLRAFHRLKVDGRDLSGVRLIVAGRQTREDSQEDLVADIGRQAAALGLAFQVVANPDEAAKTRLFQAADLFVSIADNPQETFGLTLLEAGAFGLPVIASDYDGYRDIVDHGRTGLLIPTLAQADTGWLDALAPLLPDSATHLILAQTTAVDVDALAGALASLIDDPGQRAAMGAAARERVADRFDWARIVQDWLDLWEELNAREVSAHERERLRGLEHLLAPAYGRVFSGHPSESTERAEGVRVVVSRAGEAAYRGRERPTPYAGLGWTWDEAAFTRLLFLARKSVDLAELGRRLESALIQAGQPPAMAQVRARVMPLWALKQGFLERA